MITFISTFKLKRINMNKRESIFDVYIEDIIGALIFAVLQTWMDTIIYPAMASIIAFAIVYFVRKTKERN